MNERCDPCSGAMLLLYPVSHVLQLALRCCDCLRPWSFSWGGSYSPERHSRETKAVTGRLSHNQKEIVKASSLHVGMGKSQLQAEEVIASGVRVSSRLQL